MKQTPTSNLLFVYGTLKRGWGLNRLLVGGGATFEGFVTTRYPNYGLHFCSPNGGGFPVLVPGDGHVRGELYKMPDDPGQKARLWSHLDSVEGEGHMYHRRAAEFTQEEHPDEAPIFAHVYVGAPTYWASKTLPECPIRQSDPKVYEYGFGEERSNG